jgi:hypothetical protein
VADFSSSGIADLPGVTADALLGSDSRDGARGDPRVLGWLREAVIEGDRLLQSDPSYDKAEIGMKYIVGEQTHATEEAKLKYLPQMIVNEARRVVQAHASILTDLKPVWAYKAVNPIYVDQGNLLNKLVIAWYLGRMVDLELSAAVKYALAAGTSDTIVEWDPHLPNGGDFVLQARDFRDTLPWRPAPMSRDVQDWQGVIFREEHSLNVLRGMYPTKAPLFVPTSDSLLSTLMGRFRRMVSRIISPAADTLAGLTSAGSALKPKSANVLLYRTFLDDHTRNLTNKPLPMGPPGASWAYVCHPGELLYPRKRCIIATPDFIVWDGPSPFWHGLFPFSRLMLWTVPWQFLGIPLLNDLIPIQDAINESANDLRLGIKQWMNRITVFDRQAVGETFMRTFDPRRPGAKVKTNPTYGDGFKQLEGPAPQVLGTAMQFHQAITEKFNDLSGVTNLQAILQLRQMPGAETIQRYTEAMTPELRSEGRQIEAYLRPVAEMLKVGIFQFYTQSRRVTLLGDAGLTLNDFDFDPGNMVPALNPGDQGYTPELDASIPREERAMYFHKMFAFQVVPGSILAMNAAERKMVYLQLARMGYLDLFTLLEVLEVPNVGQPPPMPLPPIVPPSPIQIMSSLQNQDGKYIISPTGQVLEVRVPVTIIERLMAQQQMGVGETVSPAGRKASGAAMPHAEPGKTDQTGAPRSAISESHK